MVTGSSSRGPGPSVLSVHNYLYVYVELCPIYAFLAICAGRHYICTLCGHSKAEILLLREWLLPSRSVTKAYDSVCALSKHLAVI